MKKMALNLKRSVSMVVLSLAAVSAFADPSLWDSFVEVRPAMRMPAVEKGSFPADLKAICSPASSQSFSHEIVSTLPGDLDAELISLVESLEPVTMGQVLRTHDGRLVSHADAETSLQLADLGYLQAKPNQAKLDLKAQMEAAGYLFHELPDNNGLVIHKGNWVHITFAGTKSLADVMTDANFFPVYNATLDAVVHGGFEGRAQFLMPAVVEILESIAREQGVQTWDLQVSTGGHSLGGALSQMILQLLDKQGIISGQKGLFMVASPEVFASDVPQLVHGFSVNQGMDPVTFTGMGRTSPVSIVTLSTPLKAHALGGYKKAATNAAYGVESDALPQVSTTLKAPHARGLGAKVGSLLHQYVEKPLAYVRHAVAKVVTPVAKAAQWTIAGAASWVGSKVSSWFSAR